MTKVDITTKIIGDSKIEQDIDYRDMGGKLVKQILNIGEDQVRRALINLGWTPPGEREELLRRAYRVLGYDHGDDLEKWSEDKKELMKDLAEKLDSLN